MDEDRDIPTEVILGGYKFIKKDPYGLFYHVQDGRRKPVPELDGAFTSVLEAEKAVNRITAKAA